MPFTIFSANDFPVFSGPNPVEFPGQFGKFVAYSMKSDGWLDWLLSRTGFYSLLKIGGTPGDETETVYGGIDDKGMQRKFTIYLGEQKEQKEEKKAEGSAAAHTMPGYFFERFKPKNYGLAYA